MSLHPFHAQIARSCAPDWQEISPDEGCLDSGLELTFSPYEDKWVVKGRLHRRERLDHIAIFYPSRHRFCIKDLPTSFVGKVQMLQSFLQYHHVVRLHQWLQAVLINAGEHGTWLVSIDRDISIESTEIDRRFFSSQLPMDLAKALQALQHRSIPSFGLSPLCARGNFFCALPNTQHARLKTLAFLEDLLFTA